MKVIQTPSRKIQNVLPLLVNSKSTKAILVFVLLFMFTISRAQVFYGTTSGGENGVGSIFKVNGDGTGFKETRLQASIGTNNVYSRGYFDRNSLFQFSNGKFYGATTAGGANEDGVLFEYDPITKEYIEKIDFYFYGSDILASNMVEYNGKLYGATLGMGASIFSYDPATNSYKKELGLQSRSSGLIQQGGKFYGTTYNGGSKKGGAIFEYNPKTAEFTILFSLEVTLTSSTGRYPEGNLTYHDGKLYGVTTSGGLYTKGTIFEYDLSSHQFAKKIDFKADVTGSRPIGDLSFYNNKLFGITSGGGNYNLGTLFEFDLNTQVVSKMIDFSPQLPRAVVKLINGKLYGVSTDGGIQGYGILFSFDPESKDYVNLFEFNETASHPFGELGFYGNTLVGMTSSGGKGNGGVIFEYDITSDQLQVEADFNYVPYGTKPVAFLEVGNSFYALTSDGGANDYGALIEVNSETFGLTNLHDLNCGQCEGYRTQQTIEGKLLIDNNVLYGIITKGGNDKGGELFAYDIDQKIYSTLVEFASDETGLVPVGNIALLNGKIVGATKLGGAVNGGVLFEYDIESSNFQVKQSLAYLTTGSDLRFTAAGNTLYGIGNGGSFGNGILNTYDPVSNTLTPKYEFQNPAEGLYPLGTLSLASPKLYGITQSTEGAQPGALFEFDTQTQLYKKIPNLPVDGAMGSTMVIIGNKLYAATKVYAATPGASLFEFDLDKSKYNALTSIRLGIDYYDNINNLIVHEGVFHTTPALASEVVEFLQGKRKDGKTIDIKRSHPQNALYLENNFDWYYNGIQFASLGFGGSITLAFDNPLYNKSGFDLHVSETSYGNPPFYNYPEQAEIFISQNGDDWTSLGYTNTSDPQEECRATLDTEFDIQHAGLDWIQFVKVVDVTNPLAKRREKNTCIETESLAFNNAADGFDLDAIQQIKTIYPNYASGRAASNKNSEVINISAPYATALLYPNPASSTLSINLSEEQELAIMEDDFHLEIIDTQGKTWNDSRELMDETWTINHDVSKLNPGMYIARVTNGNVRRHYKFMKD